MSALIVGAACALIFLLWYPHPYFQAVGAWNVLRVLIGVDLVVGPAADADRFQARQARAQVRPVRHRARAARRTDLRHDGDLPRAAVLHRVRARPLLRARAARRRSRAIRATRKPRAASDDKPLSGPLLVVATRPSDGAGLQKLLDETVFGGKPDIERRPEFWSRYEDASRAGDRPRAAARRAARGAAATRLQRSRRCQRSSAWPTSASGSCR